MAIKSLEDRPKGPTPIEIDLTGPEGNAYYPVSYTHLTLPTTPYV